VQQAAEAEGAAEGARGAGGAGDRQSGAQQSAAQGTVKDTRQAASAGEGSALADEVDVLEKRPVWVPEGTPYWVWKTHHPAVQLAVTMAFYVLHLLVLSKSCWTFPGQLIANDKGAFQSIGMDSIAGLLVLAAAVAARAKAGLAPIPNLGVQANPPWRLPRDTRKLLGGTTAYLLLAYIASGYGAVFCEQVLLLLSVYNVPLTIPTMRAWKVLLGHLMWVYMGIRILGSKHKPFFPPKGTWLRWRTQSNWVWWVVGSYFVSALLFNMADLVNQFVLPTTVFDEESVVSKLVNPENKDLLAMAVGAIGPCVPPPETLNPQPSLQPYTLNPKP